MTRGLSLYKFAGRWHCGEEAGKAHSTCAHDGPLRVRFKHPAVAFRALSFRLGINQAFAKTGCWWRGISTRPCTWCGRLSSCRA